MREVGEQGWWAELSEEERLFEKEATTSRSYVSLLAASGQTLKAKQKELEGVCTLSAFVIMALIAGWVWDHEAQADRYAMAMSNWCPMWSVSPARCQVGRMPLQ